MLDKPELTGLNGYHLETTVTPTNSPFYLQFSCFCSTFAMLVY